MKVEIIRIEENIITVKLDGDTLLDIARRWFNPDIKVGDVIEFDMTKDKR